jgi:hypothetical protein
MFWKFFHHQVSRPSIVFVAMAGLAYFASKKLDEAAIFLADQAKEMKLFVDSVENLVEGKMVSFPSGQELINSLKDDLLPSLAEVIEGSVDVESVKNDLVELGEELGVNSQEELEELAQEEIDKLKDSDVLSELSNFGKSAEDLKSFEADEFSNAISYEKGFIELLLDSISTEAIASKKIGPLKATPSCFYRTKTYVKMNESCSCKRSGNCARTLFPKQLKASNKAKSFQGIFQFAVRADQANNLIMRGNPEKGIQLYRGLYSKVAKVDAMTRTAISKKMGNPLSRSLSSKMAGSMIRSTKPALADYLKKRRVRKAPIQKARRSPLLSKEVRKKERKQKKLREKIQKNLMMAKALGNPKLSRFAISTTSKLSQGDLEYVYDQKSIVTDKDKNIFNIIKKRYLIIMKDGRL